MIAKIFDLHPETLTKFLRLIGVKERVAITPPELERILKFLNDRRFYNMTRKALGEAYDCHPETIAKVLKELGITHHKKLTIQDLLTLYGKYGMPKIRTRK